MLPIAVASHADQTTYKTLVSEPISGVLRSVGVAEGMDKHHFSITIDGRDILNPQHDLDPHFHTSLYHGSGESNHAMSLNLDFPDLEIEIRDGYVRSPDTRFWAVYELDESEISEERLEELKPDDTESGFTYLISPGEGTDRRILQGRTENVHIELDDESFSLEESIRGDLILTDWRGEQVRGLSDTEVGFELLYRDRYTIDTTTVRVDGEGAASFEIPLDDVDVETPGEYTLRSRFDRRANYGAMFLLR